MKVIFKVPVRPRTIIQWTDLFGKGWTILACNRHTTSSKKLLLIKDVIVNKFINWSLGKQNKVQAKGKVSDEVNKAIWRSCEKYII